MRGEELEEGQENLQQMLLHRRGGPRPVGPTKRGRRVVSVWQLAAPPVEAADEDLVLAPDLHYPADRHLGGLGDAAHCRGPAAVFEEQIRDGRDDPLLGLPTFPGAELNM